MSADTRHAKGMLLIIVSYIACPALQMFATFTHTQHEFWSNLMNIKYVNLMYIGPCVIVIVEE